MYSIFNLYFVMVTKICLKKIVIKTDQSLSSFDSHGIDRIIIIWWTIGYLMIRSKYRLCQKRLVFNLRHWKGYCLIAFECQWPYHVLCGPPVSGKLTFVGVKSDVHLSEKWSTEVLCIYRNRECKKTTSLHSNSEMDPTHFNHSSLKLGTTFDSHLEMIWAKNAFAFCKLRRFLISDDLFGQNYFHFFKKYWNC